MTNSLVATEVVYRPGTVTPKKNAPERKKEESSFEETAAPIAVIEPLTICIPPLELDDSLSSSAEDLSSNVSLDATGELVTSTSSLLIIVKSDDLEKKKAREVSSDKTTSVSEEKQ